MKSFNTKEITLFIIIFLPLFLLLSLVNPIPQDQSYHNFADQCNMLGIVNFHNVTSNLVFIIFPLLGLFHIKKYQMEFDFSWAVLLFGVFLVAPGSAYYHYNPNDMTLIWDRLPMTIGFMGLTSFIFSKVFTIKYEKTFLSILLLIGAYSIYHWITFSDLRVYYWVQLTPIIAIIYIAIFMPNKYLKPKHLIFAVIFYILAKITEKKDTEILDMIGYSGHSIKHILAGLSVYALIDMKRLAYKHE